MPFRVAWTDGAGKPGFLESFLDHHPALMRDWSPENWFLELSVSADGEPIGFQVHARRRVCRVAARRDRIVARAAVAGPGIRDGDARSSAGSCVSGPGAIAAESGHAEDNLQSRGVSMKLGYEPAGEGWESPRGEPVRHLKLAVTGARWAEIAHRPTRIDGLDGCLPLFGAPG